MPPPTTTPSTPSGGWAAGLGLEGGGAWWWGGGGRWAVTSCGGAEAGGRASDGRPPGPSPAMHGSVCRVAGPAATRHTLTFSRTSRPHVPTASLPVAAPPSLYCSLRSVYRREFITDFSRVEAIPVSARLPGCLGFDGPGAAGQQRWKPGVQGSPRDQLRPAASSTAAPPGAARAGGPVLCCAVV